jgi:hypothetical protein
MENLNDTTRAMIAFAKQGVTMNGSGIDYEIVDSWYAGPFDGTVDGFMAEYSDYTQTPVAHEDAVSAVSYILGHGIPAWRRWLGE